VIDDHRSSTTLLHGEPPNQAQQGNCLITSLARVDAEIIDDVVQLMAVVRTPPARKTSSCLAQEKEEFKVQKGRRSEAVLLLRFKYY